ncbi:unnamed protein product [Onchocerca flexuosa]|uniref:Ovule protein n=1 Tax=Onchocerca flexuosa TaxID=387005 RepID=A0A183HJQ5_9BILA|nr:unnamed protein product [Onchocerca flexuosa]
MVRQRKLHHKNKNAYVYVIYKMCLCDMPNEVATNVEKITSNLSVKKANLKNENTRGVMKIQLLSIHVVFGHLL